MLAWQLFALALGFTLRREKVEVELGDFGVSADLWDDADAAASNGSLALLKSSEQRIFPIAFPTPTLPGQRTVQILGLYNTGTNLLQALLDKNFPGVFVPPAHGRHAFGTIFWKHVQPTVLLRKAPSLKRQLQDHDAVGLAMIRDPLAWLQSTKTAPYDLKGCMRHGPGSAWLTEPCTLPLTSDTGGGAAHTMRAPQTLPSLPAFWNEWTQDYSRLEEFGFRRNLVISYEDLVLDTEGVLHKIAQLVGVPPPATVQQKRAPAKSGPGHGREKAVAKLRSKSWLNAYSPAERAAACARLSAPLMAQYDYHDCEGR